MNTPRRPTAMMPAPVPGLPAEGWDSWRTNGMGVPTNPFSRPFSAVRRHKWLIAGVMVAAVAAGVVGTRLIVPEYEVRATIWIQSETPIGDRSGPIRSQELLNSGAWVELLKSYRIADGVVRKLALYVKPENPADAQLMSNFEIAEKSYLGQFRLDIDGATKKWKLTQEGSNYTETGNADDSVGLNARLPEKSNFLWLSYRGPDPQIAQQTLNAWAKEFVDVAGELKKRNVVQ